MSNFDVLKFDFSPIPHLLCLDGVSKYLTYIFEQYFSIIENLPPADVEINGGNEGNATYQRHSRNQKRI